MIAGINSKSEWKLPEIRKKLEAILKSTSLNDSEIFELKIKEDYENLKKKIIDLGIKLLEKEPNSEENTKILIDHVFPVKGIGTVILGIVKQGKVQSGQMLEIV
ncbi:unnamed protein product [marine sediment metagenome]|uniref:Translation elongation factor EFTu-like domain-containing protein n=1 Tax=marine sediment metagenome TaxID=412755 RepID=X1PIY0_9ZZZZ